jgi:hypothetical protein
MNTRRKGSTTTTVVGILAVLLVGGVAWYFVSERFRSQADQAFTDLTKWTPDAIAKNPTGYLDFVEQKTKEAQLKLKASRIAIADSRGKLQQTKTDAEQSIKVGENHLAELLGKYQDAKQSDAFPVKWGGRTLDKTTSEKQAIALNKEVAFQRTLLEKVQTGLGTLDAQESKIGEAEASANQQLAEITANRELLRVQSLTDDIKGRLVTMKSAVGATLGAVAATDSNSIVSLDQLKAQSASVPDNTEFEKILASHNK